jgi:hypothetical protein
LRQRRAEGITAVTTFLSAVRCGNVVGAAPENRAPGLKHILQSQSIEGDMLPLQSDEGRIVETVHAQAQHGGVRVDVAQTRSARSSGSPTTAGTSLGLGIRVAAGWAAMGMSRATSEYVIAGLDGVNSEGLCHSMLPVETWWHASVSF